MKRHVTLRHVCYVITSRYTGTSQKTRNRNIEAVGMLWCRQMLVNEQCVTSHCRGLCYGCGGQCWGAAVAILVCKLLAVAESPTTEGHAGDTPSSSLSSPQLLVTGWGRPGHQQSYYPVGLSLAYSRAFFWVLHCFSCGRMNSYLRCGTFSSPHVHLDSISLKAGSR